MAQHSISMSGNLYDRKTNPESALPVGCTAAAGSEMSNFSVITNENLEVSRAAIATI